MMFRLFLLLVPMLGAPLLADRPAHAQSAAPVVLELFTSQGCSSCPPADAFLGELARDKTLLPLSIHVDYWDYIGWKDPFAKPAHTTRQQKYKGRFSTRYIYTPQMVVDGSAQEVGSNKSAIRKLIRDARAKPKLDVRLTLAGEHVRVAIAADKKMATTTATIWLVGFDARHDTPIRRGENSGRTISYHNVVRSLVPIGYWRGDAYDQTVPLPPRPGDAKPGDGPQGVAVIIQQSETGPILGAAAIRPQDRP